MNKLIESMNINRPNQIIIIYVLLLPLNGSFETNGLPYAFAMTHLSKELTVILEL